MANIPTTSTTLLCDVAGDPQHVRWSELVARYRPMMEAFLRERFPSVEAEDVIQETFIALSRALPSYRYAPDEKGHFRNYLTGVLRNKALRALRNARQQAGLAAAEAEMIRLQDVGPSSTEAAVERAYRDAIFELALRQFLDDESVADRTKRIFGRVAINGEQPEAVAASFKMNRHAVDQAKHSAMTRIRRIVKGLEAAGNV